MYRTLLLFLFTALFTSSYAQKVHDGLPNDSCTFSFEPYDSLNHTPRYSGIIDTSGCTLWCIGTTSKSFFSIGKTSVFSIMTDTIQHYPLNANDYFIIKNVSGGSNIIYSFYHKYQTRSNRDGGIVEYSLDTGKTWENIKLGCNNDSTGEWQGIFTSNFYSTKDTLQSGQPAFTGTSNGWQYSRFQFFWGLPVRTTGGFKCIVPNVWIRFHFISDSLPDTLAGWIIDSIKIEHDNYGGSVSTINHYNLLNVYPNPNNTGIYNFPAINDEQNFTIEVINPIGIVVLSSPYKHHIDLSEQPGGIYYYRVSSKELQYTGKLILE